jgi:hypothetical protein
MKSTVYLTRAQKRALTHAARVSGRSAADLLREGIEIVTSTATASEPTLPLFDSGQPDCIAIRLDQLELIRHTLCGQVGQVPSPSDPDYFR